MVIVCQTMLVSYGLFEKLETIFKQFRETIEALKRHIDVGRTHPSVFSQGEQGYQNHLINKGLPPLFTSANFGNPQHTTPKVLIRTMELGIKKQKAAAAGIAELFNSNTTRS